MNKIITAIAFLLLLSACSRGNDGGDWVYVGCHIVHSNPVDCYPGSDRCKVYAFGPEGDKKVGQKIYFKQLRKGQKYGPVGPMLTARPCKEGE